MRTVENALRRSRVAKQHALASFISTRAERTQHRAGVLRKKTVRRYRSLNPPPPPKGEQIDRSHIAPWDCEWRKKVATAPRTFQYRITRSASRRISAGFGTWRLVMCTPNSSSLGMCWVLFVGKIGHPFVTHPPNSHAVR